ncbi:MAG: C-terminal binding protein [Spirochaetales bacterium]|nr:C-terminal binding protein [Spirochaetales bacterium]
MAKHRIVVTDDRHGSYEVENQVFREIGAKVEVHNLGDQAETVEVLREADAILVNLHPLPGDVIRSLSRCRVISRYGVGYDNVDVKAASEAGIWVARVPDFCLEDVSDHCLALLLCGVRHVALRDRRIRRGEWKQIGEHPSFRIAGRTLGLVGFGAIARALLRKVSGFGLARVLVFDPYVDRKEIEAAGAKPVGIRELLKESDYVSIHAPLTPETRGLIGARELGLMKRHAVLINTARGPLIDEAALAEALQGGKLGTAALDVFAEEPLPASSPLRKLENVILTDHCGWYSEESMVELKTKCARNALAVLKGGRPLYPVNDPQAESLGQQ